MLVELRGVWSEIVILLNLNVRGAGIVDPLRMEVLVGNEDQLGVKFHITGFLYQRFVKELMIGLSDESVKRLYVVYETVQFVRRLLMCVVTDSCLPGQYQLSAWLRIRQQDLVMDPAKRISLGAEFDEHRMSCGTAADFEVLLDKVIRAIMKVAFEVLALDGVQDGVNLSLASFCPYMLQFGEERAVVREVRHLLERLVENKRLMLRESKIMLKGFVMLFRAYREHQALVIH